MDAYLLRPLPIPESDRVLMLTKIREGNRNATSAPNYLAWRERSGSFSELAAVNMGSANLLAASAPLRVTATATTPSLFAALGVGPQLGRAFTAEEGVPGTNDVVILSHGLWTEAFGGDPDVLGNDVVVNDVPRTIVGVLPDGFRLPPFTAQLWVPLTFAPDALEAWGRNNLYVVGRLRDGVTLNQAELELSAIAADLAVERSDANEGWGIDAVPLHAAAVGGDSRRALWLVFGAAGFVLLVACVNVAGLVVARGLSRERELAVRASLGASRSRLVAQLLSETVLLSAIGAALGAALAVLGLGPVRAMVPPGLASLGEVTVDARVLVFALAMGLATGVAAGLVPAARLSRRALATGPGAGLAGLLRTRGATARGGQAMVGVQFALATVLLVGAGLMVRSIEAIYDVDVGVRHEGVSAFGASFGQAAYPTHGEVAAAVDRVLEQLDGGADIEEAAATSHLPLTGARLSSSVIIEGGAQDRDQRSPTLSIKVVTPGYLDILGIPLVQGRGFTAADDDRSEPVVLLNRAAAERLWPGEDPIGRWVSYTEDADGRPLRKRVVGIVENVRFAGPMRDPEAEVFQLHRQTTEVWRWFGRSVSFVVRTVGGAPLTLAAAQDALAAVDPNIPVVGLRSLTDTLDGSVATPRFHAALISLFATLAMTLSAVGLYGVTAFNVRRRVREIGVRMAMGADAPVILRRILVGALGTIAIGGAVGMGMALGLAGTMSSLLWQVSPRDPLTYTGTVVGLVLVGGVAALVPALRATRVDPVEALGGE